jgi:hypothetical protein
MVAAAMVAAAMVSTGWFDISDGWHIRMTEKHYISMASGIAEINAGSKSAFMNNSYRLGS